MCRPQKAILPNNKSNPYLIEEFMKVINIFWTHDGSIEFSADGDPLFYQVNLFLENAEFPIDEEDDEEYNNDNNNDDEMKSIFENESVISNVRDKKK